MKKLLRQKSALARLEAQLKGGVKPTKEGVLPLTESDSRRINAEIVTLKERIKA